MRKHKTIKVDEETHEKLWILLLELQAKLKKPLNMGDAVKYLLEYYEKTSGSK